MGSIVLNCSEVIWIWNYVCLSHPSACMISYSPSRITRKMWIFLAIKSTDVLESRHDFIDSHFLNISKPMRLCGKQDWLTDALAYICTIESQSCVEHWITTWHALRHVHHSSPVGSEWTRCAAARVNAHAVISIHTEGCNEIQWKPKLFKWFTTNLGY